MQFITERREQLKCKDCDWYGSCEYYNRRKETSQICKMFNNTWKFVEELEKIEAEIRATYNHDNWDKISRLGQRDLDIAIINNHIKELKGE